MVRQKADTDYYVTLFRRQGAGLVGAAPLRMDDTLAAIGEAQHRAQEVAGAIAFGVTGSDAEQAIEILFRTGDVPDEVPTSPK